MTRDLPDTMASINVRLLVFVMLATRILLDDIVILIKTIKFVYLSSNFHPSKTKITGASILSKSFLSNTKTLL